MLMQFAAIDIGSNAVRLLFATVAKQLDGNRVKKTALYRVPIRLGDDAFINQRISKKKQKQLIKTMHAFNYLIDVFQPKEIMACATSAMREASNGQQIAKLINKECKIPLTIIDGEMESKLIYANHIEEYLDQDNDYLYVDVGGGSTELTLLKKGKVIDSSSFDIGTIRLLKDIVDHDEWERLDKWLKDRKDTLHNPEAIGSGGNINTLVKMIELGQSTFVSYVKLERYSEYLNSYSYDERINELGLKPDRADVIIPASKIYLKIMKKFKINKIHVPQIGLADGMIKFMYDKFK